MKLFIPSVSERHRVPETQAIPRSGSDASVHRSPHHTLPLLPPQTTTDSVSTSDELSKHIVETFPNNGSEGISLGGHISVTFDKDVKTVNSSKLFEVSNLMTNRLTFNHCQRVAYKCWYMCY